MASGNGNGKHPARNGAGLAPRARALDTLPQGDDVTISLTQYEFLWRWAAHADAGNPVATEIATALSPDVFRDEFYRQSYEYLAELVAKGESTSSTVADRHLLHIAKALNKMDVYSRLSSMRLHDPGSPEELKGFGKSLILYRRATVQVDLCVGAAQLTENALAGLGDLSVKQVADNLMDRLMHLHSRLAENPGPVTQEEITSHLINRVTREAVAGVDWPYRGIQEQLGTMAPGDVVGISAYTGQGKTMFMANLFLKLLQQNVPVIVYPTEMGLRFLERAVAIYARVPKRFAEKGDWRQATDAQMERYKDALKAMVGAPWDIVKEGDLTPADIIARTRMLRRKYKGRQVIVIVDHMHRLTYGHGVKADDALGAAEGTRMFKNHATSDTDGGLTYICLFQPRQPESEQLKFRPVSIYAIRGHSGTSTELDIHMSCFRRIVKCDTTGLHKTRWGTRAALYRSEHDPMPEGGEYSEINSGASKIDDEHFYLLADKDRVNGEVARTVVMNCHSPSGYVYEDDWLAHMLPPEEE